MIQEAINRTLSTAAAAKTASQMNESRALREQRQAEAHQRRLALIQRQEEAMQRAKEMQEAKARQRVTFKDYMWNQLLTAPSGERMRFRDMPPNLQNAIMNSFSQEERKRLVAEHREQVKRDQRQKELASRGKL